MKLFTTTSSRSVLALPLLFLLVPVACGAPAPAPAAQAPAAPAQPVASAEAPPAEQAPAASASSEGPAPAAAPAAPPACPEGMVRVAGGELRRPGIASALHVKDLCVDRLETTVSKYAECVKAGACSTSGLDCSVQATWGKPGKEEQPLVCGVFDQAVDYCEFKKQRLPTTDEWEWIARGGEEARPYPWGKEAPDEQLCWAGKKKQTESCKVGSHPGDVSRDGILDMGGNVLEFTTTNQDATSATRIARGGSWNVGDPPLFLTTRLGGFAPEYRCGFLGIRCVVEAEADKTAKP